MGHLRDRKGQLPTAINTCIQNLQRMFFLPFGVSNI